MHAKEHAEEMDRFKTSLLANISNEIHKPLKEIVNSASKFVNRMDQPGARRIVLNINRDSEHLLDNIQGIIDLSRIEANRQELKPDWCDIADEIRLNIEKMDLDTRNKDIELEIIEKEDDSIRAKIDKKLFSHIVKNLVSNAIKYTNSGKITLKIDKYTAMARFRVIDTGIGINHELLPYIFDAVKPDEIKMGKNKWNSGMGLPIALRMVNLMDGQIAVESKEGDGSIFTVLLPMQVVEQESKQTDLRYTTLN